MAKISNLEAILLKLSGVKKNGSGFMAICPAHEDKGPSLSVTEKDGKVLFYCHAGCSQEAVLAKLQISLEKAVYDYTDESGALLYQVVRYEPKEFKQRKPDGAGGWIWKLGDVRRVLYKLSVLAEAQDVIIVEGEKDVSTIESLGFTATTNAGGGNAKWLDSYSISLSKKNVIIIPDNDETGAKHAEEVASSLHLRAASVKIVRVPEKYKDISDWNPQREGFVLFLTNAKDWNPDKPPENWREQFHSLDDYEHAPPLSFAIGGFLQNAAITAIAGLSGHGKTFVALSIIKALLFGPGRLWNLFPVDERAAKVIYLIPESSITPYKHRLQLMGLYSEIANDRLLTRTLSKGKTPKLDEKWLLYAAKGAHVVIDTGVRFVGDKDESSASEMANNLSEDFMGLLRVGALSVVPLFHSGKEFARQNMMTLENMIRGSSELGAILATAWGIKQIDKATNTIHIENLKPRDFQPCGPFEIIGRPNIDQTGDFSLWKAPDECGALADEQPDPKSNKGKSEAKASNMALYAEWLEQNEEMTYEEAKRKFTARGIKIADATIRGYASELKRR